MKIVHDKAVYVGERLTVRIDLQGTEWISIQLIGLARFSTGIAFKAAKTHFGATAHLISQLLPSESEKCLSICVTEAQIIDSTQEMQIVVPEGSLPTFKGLEVAIEYYLLVKDVSTMVNHLYPITVFTGNLDELRLPTSASLHKSILKCEAGQIAHLSIKPVECLAGSQLTISLTQIALPIASIHVSLLCSENEGTSEVVRKYVGDPGALDTWQLIIPISPDWQPTIQCALVTLSWSLMIRIVMGVGGDVEGKDFEGKDAIAIASSTDAIANYFELSIPIKLHGNKLLV